MFATHQERHPKEFAAQGIETMQGANRYLAEHYRAAFNEEFTVRIPVKVITDSGLNVISESGQSGHRSERSDAGVGL